MTQKNYKQNFEKEGSDDSHIFITSLVPLHLSCKQNNTVIWQNMRTGSTRFCRPIRLQFVKETADTIKAEFSYIETQIANLLSTTMQIADHTFIVDHCLYKTMVDGKVCNSLTENKSTQRCYICKMTSAQFNRSVDSEPIPYDPATLDFGLSSLHAYIRFFVCLIHISYKLPIKSW